MNTITIIDCSSSQIEYDLDAFRLQQIYIGRNDACSIRLHDDIASSRQGSFIFHENRWYFRDENSSNGTFVYTRRGYKELFHTPHAVALEDGMILRFGRPDNPERHILALVSMNEKPKGWSIVPLTDKELTLGSAASCTIRLEQPGTAAFAATITKNQDGFVLTSRMQGCFINHQPVSYPCLLQDKDVIDLCGERMIYSGECLFYKSRRPGLSLQARGVTKLVSAGMGKQKKILDNVTLTIHPNEFVAIIGGSGAGKTTVMNALSGFEPEFTGIVETSGINLKEHFDQLKSIIGFVPQQDILYENLSLQKMLANAAKLRLPKKTSSRQIRQRVSQVLEMVELTEHRKTPISKLSGGQKKRASIAVELLSDPKLFFLDEPSSGLDPGTEKSLMILLARLAKEQQKTIVMVTHNVSNLELCDQIIFMEPGGRLAFEGPVSEAREFFRASDLTDIYNVLSKDKNGQYARKFAASHPNASVPPASRVNPVDIRSEKDTFMRQLPIFLDRYFSVLLKDGKRLAMLLLQPVLIALLLVMVSSEDTFEIYNDTKSMLFSLSCSAIWLGLFNTIQEICKERVIVKREYMSRLKLLPYLAAKFIIAALLGAVQAALLGGIYCLCVEGLPEGVLGGSAVLELCISLWLTILASEALGFAVSAVAKSGDKAMTYAPFLLIVQLLFSGILFEMKGASEVLSLFTVSKWSVESLGTIADLNALPTFMELEYGNMVQAREAETIFEHTSSHLFSEWGILILMTGVCLALTLLLLRRIRKDRR